MLSLTINKGVRNIVDKCTYTFMENNLDFSEKLLIFVFNKIKQQVKLD